MNLSDKINEVAFTLHKFCKKLRRIVFFYRVYMIDLCLFENYTNNFDSQLLLFT